MRVFKLRETRGLKTEEVIVGQIVLEKKGGARQFLPSDLLDMEGFRS